MIALGVISVSFMGLFKIIYDKNLQNLNQAKAFSQQLIQVADDKKLSDTQKFQFFQEYYYFSQGFFAALPENNLHQSINHNVLTTHSYGIILKTNKPFF